MNFKPLICIAIALAGAFFAPPIEAASKEPLYIRYEKMDDEQKDKLIKKYVKKKGRFYVVSVSKYQVYTDIGDEYALSTAILMDEFYNKFTSVFKGRFSNQGRPKLYVYKDQRGYLGSPVHPPAWSAGCYSPRDATLYAFRARGLQKTLFHEGTHQLLHSYMGHSKMPLWFNEGCATNFETWELEYSGGENRKRSPAVSYRRRTMAEQAAEDEITDIDTVFGYDHRSWGLGTGEQISNRYASSWSLVNYLLSSKKNISVFNKILKGVKRQRPTQKILSSRDKQKLEKAWHEDIETRIVFYDSYVTPCLYSENKGDKSMEEVLEHLEKATDEMKELPSYKYYRGYFLSLLDKNEEALDELLIVEDEESEYPRLFELIGRVNLKLENYKMAEKYFRIALKVRPGDEEITALKKEAYDKMRAAKNR